MVCLLEIVALPEKREASLNTREYIDIWVPKVFTRLHHETLNAGLDSNILEILATGIFLQYTTHTLFDKFEVDFCS